VISALKHAFPNGSGGEIRVRYEVDEARRRLSVSDNDVGLRQDGSARAHTGFGNSIVEALAISSKPSVEITNPLSGMIGSIIRKAKARSSEVLQMPRR